MKMHLAILVVAAYLVGSFPCGAWISRLRGVDIMAVGSGNIGATNVYRTLGPAIGIVVLILDVSKGLLPTLIARSVFHEVGLNAFLPGLAAVLGHCFSPFLKFKGGKGIATGLGALLGATPLVAASALAVFAVTLAVTRFVSVASITAAVSVAVFGVLFHDGPILVAIYGGLALFVIYKHRGNIRRLMNGTERRFSLSNKRKGGNLPKDAGCRAGSDGKEDVGLGGEPAARNK